MALKETLSSGNENIDPMETSWGYLRHCFKQGTIKSAREFVSIIQITKLCQALKLNYNTLTKRLLDPKQLTVNDICRLAQKAKIDRKELFAFIANEASPE
jgi:hypothetical protein